MITRRDFWTAGMATAAVLGTGSLRHVAASARLAQEDLLKFEPRGQVTLLHLTDLHAQLVPVHFREPSSNIGTGDLRGRPPHITGQEFLKAFAIPPKSALAYGLTSEDYVELARTYGRMGGLDRIATLIKAIRAERGEDRVLLLDGGDSWQGSWTALQSQGQDMAEAMALLRPDAMTGHWEFTYGAQRMKALADAQAFPFLAQNIADSGFGDPVFQPSKIFERGGLRIAVIGQAFAYTPIANPRWLVPDWTFGLHEETMQKHVDAARQGGADVVALLSHNGFDVDRKMAMRVKGLDVVLSGHTHDALPEVTQVGKTLIIASGSNGKFISRLDLDVQGREIKGFSYKLIPVFADAIAPDAEMAALVAKVRVPHAANLARVLGQSGGLLYRRDSISGSLDDLICDAMLSERDAEIALSPGIRWGTTVLPGQNITFEDVTNATAVTYPANYRVAMPGAQIKAVLEDVADNIFNPDPYLQSGGDMVRTGGLGFAVDVGKPAGRRIGDMVLLRSGQPIDAGQSYVVTGWASVNEGVEGPPIWETVERHLAAHGIVEGKLRMNVRVSGI